jgi:alpha-glucuronidase
VWWIAFLALCLALCPPMRAETGYDAWLRYAPVDPAAAKLYAHLPAVVFTSGRSPVMEAAQAELVRGIRGMVGKTLNVESKLPEGDAIVLETFDAPVEGTYLLKAAKRKGHYVIKIAGAGDRGVLYGVFAFLRRISLGREIQRLDEQAAPYASVRWTNEWDNVDGSVERGYAGRSIFFENGHVVPDLTRARDYARLLASIGVNGCAVNSVNTDLRTLTSPFIAELAKIAEPSVPLNMRTD